MKDQRLDNPLLNLCKVLDTDYIDYGGKITRWLDPDSDYKGQIWIMEYARIQKAKDADYSQTNIKQDMDVLK